MSGFFSYNTVVFKVTQAIFLESILGEKFIFEKWLVRNTLSMVTKFNPEINKIHFVNQYTMVHILGGTGVIEVDFKIFTDWNDKLIFLEKGQYIKFCNDNFTVRKIEFDDIDIFRNKGYRVLFKHLVSIGYINFKDCVDCQSYLNNSILSKPKEILDISSKQWYWQNPFKADNEEYHIIFDVKDIVDKKYKNQLSNTEIAQLMSQYNLDAQAIYREKVGVSIKNLLAEKRLTESQKDVAFTNKSIKEITYENGYSDPAYFNRIFKSKNGTAPNRFREELSKEGMDVFINNINELLYQHHAEHREVSFYAEKMHMSVQTLSKHVQEKMRTTLGQLIRQQIIQTAKTQLDKKMPIKEVSKLLNFEENNHFSAFFKHYTGLTPTEYQNQKVQ